MQVAERTNRRHHYSLLLKCAELHSFLLRCFSTRREDKRRAGVVTYPERYKLNQRSSAFIRGSKYIFRDMTFLIASRILFATFDGGVMETINTDIIIIGAGPTGLSLACQLIRYGIDFVVIEKNATVTPFSKAIGVQARTLEVYDQIGLAEPAIERGTIASRVRLIEGGELRGEMNLGNFGKDLSEYPYMLMLEQSKNEELLYEYVRSHGHDVRWNTELENFSQDATVVTAQVKTPPGESVTIRGKFLVGCDGAS